MKCGGNFTKGHLAVCPAKDTTCTTCKYWGHFTRLCKSRRKNVKIVDSQIVNNTDCNYPSEQPDVNNDRANRECCGLIHAWSESGQSDNDDYSVSNVTTIYDDQGKELKKLFNIGLGNENQVILHIQVDSASPVSFLKQNVLHELKLRDPYVKIYPVDQATKELYCGFTNNAINITEKIIVPIFSNRWSHKECHFFLTKGHERNILGNDNLPKVGIEDSQKHYPLHIKKKNLWVYQFNYITRQRERNRYEFQDFQATIPLDWKNKNSNKNNTLSRTTKANSTKGQASPITFTGFSKNRIDQTQIRRTYQKIRKLRRGQIY